MPALEAAERGDLFVTVTGSRAVLRREHFERMKDGAVLANAGHFDVEIDLDALRELAAGRVRQVLPLVEQYELGDRRLNLLASGRVVNLAAGEGHPAAVMDMSFANLALAVEHLVLHGEELEHRVLDVPKEIDEEIARLKLESLGVEIDTLTADQREYLSSWGADALKALDPALRSRVQARAGDSLVRLRGGGGAAGVPVGRSCGASAATRKRSSSTRSADGPERVGDRGAAVDLHGGPQVLADHGEQHLSRRRGRAVERGKARDCARVGG